jgi:tRNA(fMet)-specific endonuclease VapC
VDRSLLDTDIFSEILKGKDPQVAARASAYRAEHGRYTTSVITVLEIIKGLAKVEREDRIEAFQAVLEDVEVLPLDLESAEIAGRLYAALERAGQPIGRADPMIAGIAMRHGLTLVSGNTAHYERIRALGHALPLENWRK